MEYRLLDAAEWERLKDLVPEKYLPFPETATAAVAEDESGVLQGAAFLQLQLHLEPLILRNPAVNFERLLGVLQNAVAHHTGLVYFAFIRDPKVARMAEIIGMKPMPDEVWRKEVT